MTKENGWIRFLRVVIYGISIVGVSVGASLIKTGGLSRAYADGTYAAKIQNGEIIFFVSLIILSLNIMWGMLRWFLRSSREHWTAGRIVGKLIGGGLWRTVAIVPLVLLSLFFIAPTFSKIIAQNILNQADKTPIALSSNYDRLTKLDENIEKLSREEIEAEIGELLFNNVDFDTDASNNISHHPESFFFKNASAYSSSVTTLNKAKLSSAGHFVIIYTDTGDDKISDEKAAQLAEMLEEIIAGYKTNLGFDYEYEKLSNNSGKLKKIQSVLKGSNIDEDILNSAMPVYIVNPYENGSSTLASYAGRRFKDLGAAVLVKLGGLFGEETAKLYDSTPSYPFINILPGNVEAESLAIVTAHELGHHYAGVYNYNTYSKTGSDDNFIDETAPNWMAINVLPNQPIENLINDNHYNYAYLRSYTGYKISEVQPDFTGYPAVAFLQNYYETVPDSTNIIMDAVYYGDALNYLHKKAGAENYEKVMIKLAERNLTGDYGGKLINTVIPTGETMDCTDLCEKTFYINPSATGYVYFATGEYKNTIIEFIGNDSVKGSILGLRYDGKYEVIHSNQFEIEYTISEADIEKYEVVAFAVANSSITDRKSYEVNVVAKELKDLVETVGEFNFNNLYSELQPGCYEINTDSLFDNLINLIDLGSDLAAVLERADPDDFSGVRSTYDDSASEARRSIETAKAELSPYIISVCANYIKSGSDFDAVKSRLQSALGYNVNIYSERSGADRFDVFVSIDPFTQHARASLLAKSDNDMGLITINIDQR